jgi:mannose-6-phosphate isomerase-like protein (cupin superfamily)
MRNGFIAILSSVIVLAGGTLAAQRGAPPQRETVVLEKAPTDHAIYISKAKLAQYLKDMDAKKLQTLRMIEGGKFNVNIRRITNAETALVHPTTIDTWVVLDGSGTLTTGGHLQAGKIVGGESHPLKVGDVEFIPAGVPHGVSGVNGNITWLNIRWDTDWPAGAEVGAGNMPGAAPPAGGRGLAPLEFAPTDRSVAIPLEKLAAYRRDMDAKNTATLRMIEGGHFNVNIRRITAPSSEFHKVTIDTWVVLEGSGTVSTGHQLRDGKRVPGTGTEQAVSVGDVFFIPSSLPHGFSAVSGKVAWLNVRYDDDYAPASK